MLDSLKSAANNASKLPENGHSARRKIDSGIRESLRGSFGDLLDELNSIDLEEAHKTVDPIAFQKTQSESQQATKNLLETFNYNFCYSSVKEDGNGQKDEEKRELYTEALVQSTKSLYTALNIPAVNANDIQEKLKTNTAFSFNELAWLSRPNELIERLIEKLTAKDIEKAHLANIFPNIKKALKEFLSKNVDWLGKKSLPELTAIKTNIELVLTLCDSLEVIINRHPLLYPNLSVLDQAERQPGYSKKANPSWQKANVSFPTKTKTAWSDVKNMFVTVNDSAQPMAPKATDDSEIEVWLLHASIAEAQYLQLCQHLGIKPSTTILSKLTGLQKHRIGDQNQQTNLDLIVTLIEKQVIRAEETTTFGEKPDLMNAKFALRSIIEQLDSLKKVSLRNKDNVIKVSGETIKRNTREEKSYSLFASVSNVWRKTLDRGSKIMQSLTSWLRPENKTVPASTFVANRKPRSLRRLWLAAGLAGFTSFFSGSQAQESKTDTQTTPITVLPTPIDPPLVSEANVAVPSYTNDISEQTTPDSTARSQSSIQRRLQNTLKGPQALQMFQRIYGEQLAPSEAQQIYIANTFAHILRPHLKLHSSTTTAPLHISYSGTAPHHRHIFTIWSGHHSETVRVHIPSWENLSQGMHDAGIPHIHSVPNSTPAPALTGPSEIDSDIANNSIPPLPPGAISKQATSPNVMAALNALQLADQSPNVAVKKIEQNHRIDVALDTLAQADRTQRRAESTAVNLALDELAQADRQPRQIKRTDVDLALDELAQADAKNNRRA